MTMLLQGPESYHFNAKITVQGLDRYRSETEIDPTGERLKILSVLNGNKDWFRFGGDPRQPAPDVAALKHTLYLAVIPLTLVPLKSPGFKVESAVNDKIGDRRASTLKVTCPDGEQIKISFDKESGLPVRAVGKAHDLGRLQERPGDYVQRLQGLRGLQDSFPASSSRAKASIASRRSRRSRCWITCRPRPSPLPSRSPIMHTSSPEGRRW